MSKQSPGTVTIELQGIDKRVLKHVWDKMRRGEALTGQESYIGRSMADHPDWFPVFETIGLLEGDDTLPDGENPFVHLTFHVMVGAQVFNRNPKEAEVFYRLRLRAGDEPHDIIHMMINVFQRHLAWTAQSARQGGPGEFDMKAYAKTLRSLQALRTDKLWQRLGYPTPPKAHVPYEPPD